ncbi:hypothetical protein ACHAXS_004637 [Conticribra weissflogii]
MLEQIFGYKFFTKLNISMQYYTFELDEPSQDLCVLVTPFGKYKFRQLLMGLKCAPNFAQQVMEEVLHNVNDTGIYLDNIGAFLMTWEHHILLLDKSYTVLKQMDSQLTLLNANGPFKKLTGLATG